MADLQIAPPRPSSTTPALLLAFVVLAVVALAIFYFTPHKVVDFHVTAVDPYAPSTTFTALDGPSPNGMHVLGSNTATTETNLYVIAHVRVTDHSRQPLFITGATAHLTLADGSELESNLLSVPDLKRLEVIFPEIARRAPSPIADGDQIDSGQTRTGTIVLPFSGQTAGAWQNKKIATLTLNLHNQDPQTAVLP